MPEIIDAAQMAGLDFLILTDHNTLQAREEGWEGWHDDLLVVVGQEITNRYDVERNLKFFGSFG